MVATIGGDYEDACSICLSPPTDMVMTCCAHIFCKSCIFRSHPLSKSDLFAAPDANGTNISSLRDQTSSKVSYLVGLLQSSQEENPGRKSVAFSQFRGMLVVLEELLKADGIKVLCLDKSMSAATRTNVIKKFQVPVHDEPTVLLASLKGLHAGTSLTAASTVYLFEPNVDPALEKQAIDRVHWIGEKENVKVIRLVAQNSIEERVLEFQERKKNLATEAFGRKGSKDWRQANEIDILFLLSL